MKRINVILFILILSVLFVGCANEKKYDYPDYFTKQYCYDNYSFMDYNYKYEKAYENPVDDSVLIGDSGTFYYFYAIPEISPDNFLACRVKFGFIGSSYRYALLKANNYNIDPMLDWNISKIEIFLSSSDFGPYYISSISTNTSPTLIEQLKFCINDTKNHLLYDLYMMQETHSIEVQLNDKMCNVAIRIHFNETEMIIWSAAITVYNGQYYLVHRKEVLGNEYLIPLTDEITEFISSSVSSYS